MNKYLDKLLEKSIENGWYDRYTIDTDASEIQKVLLEFGKQCFETGRKRHDYTEVLKNPGMWDEFKYETFEDYLKSLENE